MTANLGDGRGLDREQVIAAERARMVRDLLDVVADQLAAIALQSQAATQPGADLDFARSVLRTVRVSAVAALGEMRAMVGLLGADAAANPRIAPAGLSDLGALIDNAKRSGLAVRLRDQRLPDTVLSAVVDLTAYRIVQASLTSSAKHEPTLSVQVDLSIFGDELQIEVRHGRSVVNSFSDTMDSGLLGVSELAWAVGGRIVSGPDDQGWILRAHLPLASHELAGE